MAALSSKAPKVSIITVCFNSDSTIRDTLSSVQSQGYSKIEHIIVDGGSSDNTMNIVSEYKSSLGPVLSEPDKGLYDAMNKGIGMANGDIIGILNSDDFYESDDVIEVAVAAFLSNSDVDIVFGDLVFVNSQNLEKITRFYRAGHFRPWKLRFGWMPPHPATFVTKAAYEKHGKYRLDMKISADYEMFVRWLSKEKLKYVWVDQVMVRMRVGGG